MEISLQVAGREHLKELLGFVRAYHEFEAIGHSGGATSSALEKISSQQRPAGGDDAAIHSSRLWTNGFCCSWPV